MLIKKTGAISTNKFPYLEEVSIIIHFDGVNDGDKRGESGSQTDDGVDDVKQMSQGDPLPFASYLIFVMCVFSVIHIYYCCNGILVVCTFNHVSSFLIEKEIDKVLDRRLFDNTILY